MLEENGNGEATEDPKRNRDRKLFQPCRAFTNEPWRLILSQSLFLNDIACKAVQIALLHDARGFS